MECNLPPNVILEVSCVWRGGQGIFITQGNLILLDSAFAVWIGIETGSLP